MTCVDQSQVSILSIVQSQERNTELCLENSVVQPLLTDLYQVTIHDDLRSSEVMSVNIAAHHGLCLLEVGEDQRHRNL